MMELKGGHSTQDPRLDRIYAQDLRSLNFLVRATLAPEELRRPRSYTWQVGTWLDQGQEGACVGFGFSHDLIARPAVVRGVDNRFARETVYWKAQQDDPWPGGSYPGATPQYEGTSVLSGAKVLNDLGYYSSYRWGINWKEVAAAIGYSGPAVLGITMREGMMDPDANGFLRITGDEVGGHCILAHAVKISFKGLLGNLIRRWEDVDTDKSYVVVWNSWGPTWGDRGTAKISLRDLQQLIDVDKGEACFPARTGKLTA